jgi:nicotinamide mononucleotide transporter
MDIIIIIEQFWAQTWIEWTILVTSIFYIVLAARENIWCWFFGIISCSLWGYVSFNANLVADGWLQVFYVAISFWGIYEWKFQKKSAKDKEMEISQLSLIQHAGIIALGVLISFPLVYILQKYSFAEAIYLDSLTTVFAVIATFMVARKIIENWLYWMVIDLIYIYLYGSRGLWMLAVIMVIYIVIAGFGYFNWKKELK